jgi:hypothetical protein
MKLRSLALLPVAFLLALPACGKKDDDGTSAADEPKAPAGFKVAVVDIGLRLGALIPEDHTVREIEPGSILIEKDPAAKPTAKPVDAKTRIDRGDSTDTPDGVAAHWKESGYEIKLNETKPDGSWIVVGYQKEGGFDYIVSIFRKDLHLTCTTRVVPDPAPMIAVCDSLAPLAMKK